MGTPGRRARATAIQFGGLMRKSILTTAAFALAAALMSGTCALAVPVTAADIKPMPLLVLPDRSDLLNPSGTVKGSSPYLAGVGGTGAYSGVGTLVITSDNSGNGAFLCTASLISPTVLLTAAHCVKNPEIGHVDTMTFVLPNGRPAFGASPAPNPGAVQFATGGAFVTDPSWNPNTFAGDIALVKLDTPIAGTDIYDIYRGDPMGQQFSQVGTGTAGWGAVGADSQTGYLGGLFDLRKRVGDNIFEEYGVPFFDGFYNQFGIDVGIGGPGQGIVLFDFDSGLAANDVFGLLSGFSDPSFSSLTVSQTGVANETDTAPGDSGGPAFIGGKIAAITSFGITGALLSFDGTYIYCGPGEIDVSWSVDTGSCTDSSFGEIAGDTNVSYYQDFVDAGLAGELKFILVPEPASAALLLGGLAGALSLRRRKKAKE
jgi:hypothetical protein